MKIEDLKISQKDKDLLEYLKAPRTIPEVAFFLGTNYNYASTKLMVLLAGNLIIKIKSFRKVRYYLNQDEVEL